MTRKEKIQYLKARQKGLQPSLPFDPTQPPLFVNVKDGICRVNRTGELFPEDELEHWKQTSHPARDRNLVFVYRVPPGMAGGLYFVIKIVESDICVYLESRHLCNPCYFTVTSTI